MPPGYTSQQKAAISQFQSFTSTDRNTAVKVCTNFVELLACEPAKLIWKQHLKNHNWNQEAAVNG
jgi:DCN1-like protein 1/2